MYRNGHIGAALAAYAPLALVSTAIGGLELGVLGGVVAAGISKVPDWDQHIPFVKHRGATHTIHFAVIMGVLLGISGLLVGATYGILAAIGGFVYGLLLGTIPILSHIGADALTPAGVEPFRDERHYSYNVVKAANPLANYALLGLGALLSGVAILLGSALRTLIL